MALGVYKSAVQDCQEAVKSDRNFAKGYVRLSSALFLSGATLEEAISVLETRVRDKKVSGTAFAKELNSKMTEFSLLAAALIEGKEALQLLCRGRKGSLSICHRSLLSLQT